MQRVSTTVVALVGSDAARHSREIGEAGNVLAIVPDDAPPLHRAQAAWAAVTATSRTYAVHDADPLLAVVTDWVALFDSAGTRGDLEMSVSDTVARWRARAIELPDFYLVLDAEALPATVRHWYLGVLRSAAPSRVVPIDATTTAVERTLRHLPAGRWWPDVPELLDGIDRVAPDAVAAPPDEGPSALVR